MSLTYGFYDSLNGDRKYNARQLASIFDGVISDGVFATYGGHFLVSAVSGMNIKVASGRAWLNHTWTLNDVDYPLTVDTAEVVTNRIDTVIIEIDESQDKRQNQIKILKGSDADTPSAPTLTNNSTLHQYALADIYVGAGVTEITVANITNRIGTGTLPWVTGLIDTIDASDLTAQWNAQVNALLDQLRRDIEQVASMVIPDGAVTYPKLASDAVKLIFTNTVIQTTQFAEDTTYEDFPYKVIIGLSDAVTPSMLPEVIFGAVDASSGVFAPVADSVTGGIIIYASEVPEAAVTIPTIILWR
nr:MAG TPA: Receptor Binding Protein [Caudoviricetes sp.]